MSQSLLKETLEYIEDVDKQKICQLIPSAITSSFQQVAENYQSIEHVLPKQGLASLIQTEEDELSYIARMYENGEAQEEQIVVCFTDATEGNSSFLGFLA